MSIYQIPSSINITDYPNWDINDEILSSFELLDDSMNINYIPVSVQSSAMGGVYTPHNIDKKIAFSHLSRFGGIYTLDAIQYNNIVFTIHGVDDIANTTEAWVNIDNDGPTAEEINYSKIEQTFLNQTVYDQLTFHDLFRARTGKRSVGRQNSTAGGRGQSLGAQCGESGLLRLEGTGATSRTALGAASGNTGALGAGRVQPRGLGFAQSVGEVAACRIVPARSRCGAGCLFGSLASPPLRNV